MTGVKCDHLMVSFRLSYPRSKTLLLFRTFLLFKNMDKTAFGNHIASMSWNKAYFYNDINDKLAFFSKKTVSLFDLYASEIKIKNKCRKLWITEEIKAVMKERDVALRIFRTTRMEADWENYKSLRNRATDLSRKACDAHFADNIRRLSNDPEALWRFLKSANVRSPQKNKLPQEFSSHSNDINNHFVEEIKVEEPDRETFKFYSTNICRKVRGNQSVLQQPA